MEQPYLVPSDNSLEIKSPVFIPRPGWGGQLSSFFKKILRTKTIFASLLAIFAIVGINRLIQNRADQGTVLPFNNILPTSENTAPGNRAAFAGTFSITAKPGQGITHLARHIIKRYSQENGITLTPEQKVYAEDFLRRTIYSTGLVQSGQIVNFRTEDVENAVKRAKQLSDRLIQNLTPYANRVREF